MASIRYKQGDMAGVRTNHKVMHGNTIQAGILLTGRTDGDMAIRAVDWTLTGREVDQS